MYDDPKPAELLGMPVGLAIFFMALALTLFIIGVWWLIATATKSREILEELKKLNSKK